MTPPVIAPAPAYDHVVVPLDGSELAYRAVAEGRAIAQRIGAKLHLFHAEGHWNRRDTGMRRDIEQLADRIGATAEVRSEGVNDRPPAEMVHRFVSELGRAAVVMATHGRTGLGAAVLGSVTSDLIALSNLPVVVAGPQLPNDSEAITRVVACLDPSDFSSSILPEAAGWAKALAVPLWLVESLTPADAPTGVSDVAESSQVHRVAAQLEGHGLDVEWEVLHDKHPADAIVRYVNNRPGTMTVLATHGRSGLKRVVLGSVASSVVRQARGPVVVQRPAD